MSGPSRTAAPVTSERVSTPIASSRSLTSRSAPRQPADSTAASAAPRHGIDLTNVPMLPPARPLAPPIQASRRAAGSVAGGPVAESLQQPTVRGGQPLPRLVRARMETAFGSSFADVRVHQGSQAAALGALAYTQGSHIHFAPGRYRPDSAPGQALLGHELTHIVQQRTGRVSVPQGKAAGGGAAVNTDPALEGEADLLGARAARGERVTVRGAASLSRSSAGGGLPPDSGGSGSGGVIQRAAALLGWENFQGKDDLNTPLRRATLVAAAESVSSGSPMKFFYGTAGGGLGTIRKVEDIDEDKEIEPNDHLDIFGHGSGRYPGGLKIATLVGALAFEFRYQDDWQGDMRIFSCRPAATPEDGDIRNIHEIGKEMQKYKQLRGVKAIGGSPRKIVLNPARGSIKPVSAAYDEMLKWLSPEVAPHSDKTRKRTVQEMLQEVLIDNSLKLSYSQNDMTVAAGIESRLSRLQQLVDNDAKKKNGDAAEVKKNKTQLSAAKTKAIAELGTLMKKAADATANSKDHNSFGWRVARPFDNGKQWSSQGSRLQLPYGAKKEEYGQVRQIQSIKVKVDQYPFDPQNQREPIFKAKMREHQKAQMKALVARTQQLNNNNNNNNNNNDIDDIDAQALPESQVLNNNNNNNDNNNNNVLVNSVMQSNANTVNHQLPSSNNDVQALPNLNDNAHVIQAPIPNGLLVITVPNNNLQAQVNLNP